AGPAHARVDVAFPVLVQRECAARGESAADGEVHQPHVVERSDAREIVAGEGRQDRESREPGLAEFVEVPDLRPPSVRAGPVRRGPAACLRGSARLRGRHHTLVHCHSCIYQPSESTAGTRSAARGGGGGATSHSLPGVRRLRIRPMFHNPHPANWIPRPGSARGTRGARSRPGRRGAGRGRPRRRRGRARARPLHRRSSRGYHARASHPHPQRGAFRMSSNPSLTDTLAEWPVVKQALGAGEDEASTTGRTRRLRSRLAGVESVGSICPYCAVGCATLVHLKDGRVVSIEGDPESPINEGTLCPKGANTFQYTINPRRLTKALYRRPYGTEWEEVELEWAMDRIAERFRDT